MRIDRSTVLGNPFKSSKEQIVGDPVAAHKREVEAYRVYLHQMHNGEEVDFAAIAQAHSVGLTAFKTPTREDWLFRIDCILDSLRFGDKIALLGRMKPLPCHGDALKDYLNWRLVQERNDD